MIRSLLIVNPAAGAGRWLRAGEPSWRLDRLLASLRRRRPDLELAVTKGPGDASLLARQAAEEGVEVVWALGGDGTLREVASGLAGSSSALGILPGGTTNVLARSLGLPRDPESAWEALDSQEKPRARLHDLGVTTDGRGTERVFLMMMSRGLDARALFGLAPELKRRYGRAAVLGRGLWEWLRAAEPCFELELPEDGERRTASFIAACNIALYGGGFTLAPDASPFDGALDLVGLPHSGRRSTLSFALGLVLRRQLSSVGAWRKKTTRLALPGAGKALVQLDGDGFELELPIAVNVSRHRVVVLVGPEPPARRH